MAHRVRRSSEHLLEISATDKAEVLLAKIQSLLRYPIHNERLSVFFHVPRYAPRIGYALGFGVEESEQILLDLQILDDGLDDQIRILDGFRARKNPFITSIHGHQQSHKSVMVVKLGLRILRRRDPRQDPLRPLFLAELGFRGHLLGYAGEGFVDDVHPVPIIKIDVGSEHGIGVSGMSSGFRRSKERGSLLERFLYVDQAEISIKFPDI